LGRVRRVNRACERNEENSGRRLGRRCSSLSLRSLGARRENALEMPRIQPSARACARLDEFGNGPGSRVGLVGTTESWFSRARSCVSSQRKAAAFSKDVEGAQLGNGLGLDEIRDVSLRVVLFLFPRSISLARRCDMNQHLPRGLVPPSFINPCARHTPITSFLARSLARSLHSPSSCRTRPHHSHTQPRLLHPLPRRLSRPQKSLDFIVHLETGGRSVRQGE